MRTSAAACLVVLALATAGCHRDNVARIYDGREVSGHWVSPEAYAAFAEAALLDAQGNRAAAADAYERAIVEDTGNAAAWARLGAMRCVSSRTAADQAFARAERLDPDLESPWLARAGCALERGDARTAVACATRAVALSPDDPEANLLVAAALNRSGDARGAERWRRGLSLFAADAVPTGASPSRSVDEAFQRALSSGKSAEVERAAIRARVTSAELSLRAAARGQLDISSRVAESVLLADPSNSDARIGALTSADLARDEQAFQRWVRGVPKGTSIPNALGAELMEALISRRLGAPAARSWSDAYRSIAGH